MIRTDRNPLPDSPDEPFAREQRNPEHASRQVGEHTLTFSQQLPAKHFLLLPGYSRIKRPRIPNRVPGLRRGSNPSAVLGRPVRCGYYPEDLANANSLAIFSARHPPTRQDSQDIHRIFPSPPPWPGENTPVMYLRPVRPPSGSDPPRTVPLSTSKPAVFLPFKSHVSHCQQTR